MDESKYLGCYINNKTNATKEINRRKQDVMITWKRLGEFWKDSNCSVRTKTIIYDAAIRAKLMHRLETLQLNQDH